MLQTKFPYSRNVRSNSLNVPDGAITLSIQVPSKGQQRKGSICSCSRCSWTSETERPRSGMTESTNYSDVDSISQFPQSRPQSECNLNLINSSFLPPGTAAAKRSASADYFPRNNFRGNSSPTPPSEGQSQTGSRTSISISHHPSIDQTIGQIKIKLHYNLEMGSLDVSIIKCQDLPHFGKHNPNAIVYVSLLPDDGYLEHSRVKTKCKKNSHNPIFGEILKFPNLTKFELDDRTLLFQVFHIDPFSKKSLIGETQIKIEDYPWSEEDPIWLPLKKELIISVPTNSDGLAPELPSRRGLLRFEISFKMKDPKKQRIDINFYAKSGNNLTGDPPILCKMPFVKANLLSNRKIISSARSSLAEFHGNGFEPCWNYNIVIQDQSLEKLKKRALEISVWDRENSTNNRYIGRLLFYLSDPKKQEKTTQSLWRKLIETPGAKFVAELQLQP
uniref:C2 domain-containing protein n=1 Tax=Panagrolaimus sp. PS1159 TaxID=55785 RepID=A0AC35FP29_9BILA